MIEKQLKYTRTHEWIEAMGKVRKIGLTHLAQKQLGDVVFFDAPARGRRVAAGDEAAVVESCKATVSVYAPLNGTILSSNPDVQRHPELINQSPYDKGWLLEFEVEDKDDDADLLDADQYETYCQQARL